MGKGAQRWLDWDFSASSRRSWPNSAVPMMITWFRGKTLPPTSRRLAIAGIMILAPVLMIAKQPDLGTSLLVASAGIFVLSGRTQLALHGCHGSHRGSCRLGALGNGECVNTNAAVC